MQYPDQPLKPIPINWFGISDQGLRKLGFRRAAARDKIYEF